MSKWQRVEKLFISDSDSARGTIILATLVVGEVKFLEIQAKYVMLKPQVCVTGHEDLWNQPSVPYPDCLLSFFFLTDTMYERSAGPGTGRRWMGRNTGYELMSK